jgi:NADH dehydrogenase/NADH:ubiquinone oxidoreductase subunit G
MKLNRSWTIAFVLFAVAAVPAVAQETESAVPELSAFHEVIYPIWHTAYPDKDIAMLKSLVPQVNELAGKVYAAKLPGILRDKQVKYDAGLAEFRAAVEAYNAAAKGSVDKAMLDAAEVLHAKYEMLVRILRPVLKEMDDFHKVLYVVYHTDLPAKNWAAVRAAAPDLKAKAEAVTAAKLSTRLEPKAEAFAKASGELVKAATVLAGLDPKADGAAVEQAVQKLHSRYQDLEKVFD